MTSAECIRDVLSPIFFGMTACTISFLLLDNYGIRLILDHVRNPAGKRETDRSARCNRLVCFLFAGGGRLPLPMR